MNLWSDRVQTVSPLPCCMHTACTKSSLRTHPQRHHRPQPSIDSLQVERQHTSHGYANNWMYSIEKVKNMIMYLPAPPSHPIDPIDLIKLMFHGEFKASKKTQTTSFVLPLGMLVIIIMFISAYRPCPRCRLEKSCESSGVKSRLLPTSALEDGKRLLEVQRHCEARWSVWMICSLRQMHWLVVDVVSMQVSLCLSSTRCAAPASYEAGRRACSKRAA